MSFIRKIKNWIKQSISYSIFIWKNDNYDWDYAYFLSLMKFKLSRMSKTIKDNDFVVSNKRIAKQINYAVYLIDRLQSNRDFDKYHKDFEERWGKISIAPGNTFDLLFDKANTPDLKGIAREEYSLMVDRIYVKEQELYDRLFRHIRKYIQRWWD